MTQAEERYEGVDRRHVDPIQAQIDELIMQASEPKDKALLLIFNKFAANLEANTELTRNLSEELRTHTQRFENHEKKEVALLNQGRGFIYAALLLVGVVQGLIVWVARGHLDEMMELKEYVMELRLDMTEHKEHHRQEERFRDGPKVNMR